MESSTTDVSTVLRSLHLAVSEYRTMHVFLETERLLLSRFTSDDVDALVELNSDPDVMRFVPDAAFTPRHEIENDYLPAYLG